VSIANDAKLTTSWNSKDGLERLNRSKYNSDFYQLANFYQPQENPLYCGAATAVIILNASNYGEISSQKTGEVKKPKDLGGDVIPFKLYLQQDFFNKKVQKIKSKKIIDLKQAKKLVNGDPVYDPGVTLSEFSQMLKYGHNFKVTKIHALKNTEKEIEQFRKNLKTAFTNDKKYIIANYNGKKIGKKTGGHISPVVAYDEQSDSVLILDVALHKEKWFWVSIQEFYEAMNTKDGDKYRGYLIVRKK